MMPEEISRSQRREFALGILNMATPPELDELSRRFDALRGAL